MDLSVNKIRNSKLQKINFKGVKGGYDINNVPVVKFVPPPYNDKTQRVFLEYTFLETDEETNRLENPSQEKLQEAEFYAFEPLLLPNETFKNGGKGIAYRYRIESNDGSVKYVTDSYETIPLKDSSERLNVIEAGKDYEVTPKAGTMRHSFIDSDAIIVNNKLNLNADKDFVRNHFNKLKGSVKGLLLMLKQTDILDPYRYIITTPDIGVDKISSHKYWPCNLYQCSDLNDFKDFNFELYKRGKGYVADGAFTSQSIQSPLIQHVLKWGQASPWFNIFKIEGKPQLGLIPKSRKEDDDDPPEDHIGVRIVNNPADRVKYDASQPTYFQLFDDRLASEEQINDSTKLIEAYDKNIEDHYDIISNEDSAYPFYFEIDPLTMPQRMAEFKDRNSAYLYEIRMGKKKFLDFDNFTIVKRNDAGGASYWDGNRDMVKFNLSNPDRTNIEDIKGTQKAREYLLGIATYWTEAIQSDLIYRTAQMSDKEKEKTALNNDISQEDYQEIKSSIDESQYPVLEQNKTINDYIEEFPLQSIETGDDLSAVFAQSEFKKEFLTEETEKEIALILNDVIENVIPKQYKHNNEYKTYVVKTCANRILKNIYVSAMGDNLINKDGSLNYENLKRVNIKNLDYFPALTPESERKQVIKRLHRNLNRAGVQEIEAQLKKELAKISLEDFKLAESIVLQSKAGLNWRFDAAKDIGDLDSARAQNTNFKDLFWKGDYSVCGFWEDYCNKVRQYNPSAYIISELTDLWDFYNTDKFTFDDNGYNPDLKERDFIIQTRATANSNYSKYFNKLSNFVGTNPENFDGVPINSGNLKALKDNVVGFISSVQPNNALLSHMFVDNHDKPRIMHSMPLDMRIFLNDTTKEGFNGLEKEQQERINALFGNVDYNKISSRAIAVALIMNDLIEQEYEGKDKEKLKAALLELAKGQKTSDSKPDRSRSEAFGNLDYRISAKDMFKRAGIVSESKLDDAALEFNYKLLKNSMHGVDSLWQMMNAIPGTPTLFNGTEYAQTGYEEKCKNITVKNREQIVHELKDNPLYKPFYDKMFAVSSLYQQPGMSALRGGFTLPLEVQGIKTLKTSNDGAMNYFIENIEKHGGYKALEEFFETYDGKDGAIKDRFGIDENNGNKKNFIEFYKDGLFKKYYQFESENKELLHYWPLYNYDEKGSQVVSVITNNGLEYKTPSYKTKFQTKNVSVDSIKLTDSDGSCPLAEGTVLKKKVYKNGSFVDDGAEYTIKNKRIVNKNGSNIVLNDTVNHFYVANKRGQDIAFRAIYNGAH